MRLLVLLSLFAGIGTIQAQPTTAEYKLKAVYLYNFLQYVDFPPNAFADEQSPIVIGVLGNDPFGNTLDETIVSEVVKNRRLEVRRFKRVNDITDCHVLFIGASEEDKLKSILSALKGRSILTVGDVENFARLGGVIRFLTENNKIRLKINLEAAKEANLSISSKLLQIAEIISTVK